MRIIIDMDGIVVDAAEKWLRRYNGFYGDSLTKDDMIHWNFQDIVKPEAKKYVGKIWRCPGFFDDMKPMPGAKAAIKALKKVGHEVRICTSPASEDSARAKLAWCSKHLKMRWSHVFICGDKHWVEADLLIDDKPKNITNWLGAGRPHAMTIAWPFNKELEGVVDCYAQSYRDTEAAWKQIVDAVAAIERVR